MSDSEDDGGKKCLVCVVLSYFITVLCICTAVFFMVGEIFMETVTQMTATGFILTQKLVLFCLK